MKCCGKDAYPQTTFVTLQSDMAEIYIYTSAVTCSNFVIDFMPQIFKQEMCVKTIYSKILERLLLQYKLLTHSKQCT